MSKSLHLYTSDSDLTAATGTIGLLCEFAPDSPWLRATEHYYGPDEILGSVDAALPVAYSLVSKLLQSAPIIEGLPLLSIFEESLLEQMSYILQTFQLRCAISRNQPRLACATKALEFPADAFGLVPPRNAAVVT